jgi:hypothetical protein
MSRKKIKILVVLIGVILLSTILINEIILFFQIDYCLDSGGRWNYETNECEPYNRALMGTNTQFYWHTEHDTILNKEYLVRGDLVDSISGSPHELVEILNIRKAKCKIELIDIVNDTICIKILNDEILTEQMGSSGAFCYLGETVFTLTEYDLLHFVKIEMDFGSHGSPGIYQRKDFKELLIK